MESNIIDKHIRPFINANYHKFLGISKEEFIKLIPDLEIPKNDDFNIPLIIISSKVISFEKQLELAGIRLNVSLDKIHLNEPFINKPYWIMIQDGTKNRGKSPDYCKRNINSNERGLTIVEGVALYLQYPEILKNHSVDLIGSSYGKECTPTVYSWNNKTMVSAICSDVSDSMCGSATCLNNYSN